MAWASSGELGRTAQAINEWSKENVTSSAYTASMKRYFEKSKTSPASSILSVKHGKISHYDSLFKKYAPQIGWDWNLLAALAFTESNFDTTAVSWAGAKGMMQLMPSTAKAMGMPSGKEQNPEESIKAAVKYIKVTSKGFSKIPEKERVNFVLGAYNSGIGHIYDAMALAKKYGYDPTQWYDNVEKYILLKSHEEYFTDSVCKFGYFRGNETYNFVRSINDLFRKYQELIKEP